MLMDAYIPRTMKWRYLPTEAPPSNDICKMLK